MSLAASAPAADGLASKVGHSLKEGAHNLKEGAHRGQEIGQDMIETAAQRSAPLAKAARKRGEAALDATRENGGKLAADAQSEVRRLARQLW